ncbi:hypothetical protein BCR43DRAFT_483658 [Syncephalastrum racemosum]|uniref:UBX domain-containing protein n=1 Tax=Syncephalastrum racemosum TaxID=13706 RepID=A0A1X2HVM0_SYNRA|nr:hypothetical protein BCR43DRAFT_483658 [Syncephalastrum racemosum]
MTSTADSATPSAEPSESSSAPDRSIKVYTPPSNAPARVEMPESFYKLSPNEVKALYKSHVDRRENLENRPLKTQKIRNVEDQERMKKYPRTTIRVRLPDHIILQAQFDSKERVSDVYDFVRSTLTTPERKFLLCLPPRTKLVEPVLTLYKAGLAPASNVTFVWIDPPTSNASDMPNLTKEYLDKIEPFPSPAGSPASQSSASPASPSSSASASSSQQQQQQGGKKQIPKWLQKGLFKK